MDLNSPLFDRIRVKSSRKNAPAPTVAAAVCSHPGCKAEGVFKAPKGRDREGEYFCFCKDHVREYNATYDYFKGMDDESMVANCCTHPHDPSRSDRVDPFVNDLPYDWGVRHQ